MDAITLNHPWAVAVADWGKMIENRSWAPPARAQGQWLAIHGGPEPSGADRDEAQADLDGLVAAGLAPWVPLAEAVRPGVVAVCRLVRCISGDDEAEPLLDSPWYTGPFGWVLSDVVELPEPVPCPGARGLWPLPPPVLAGVRWQYRLARPSRLG